MIGGFAGLNAGEIFWESHTMQLTTPNKHSKYNRKGRCATILALCNQSSGVHELLGTSDQCGNADIFDIPFRVLVQYHRFLLPIYTITIPRLSNIAREHYLNESTQVIKMGEPTINSDITFKGWMGLDKNALTDGLKLVPFEPKKWEETDIDVKITHCGLCASDLHTLRSGWVRNSIPCLI